MTNLATLQALISNHGEPQDWDYDFTPMSRNEALVKLPEALTHERTASMKDDSALSMRWSTKDEPLKPGPEIADTSESTLKREFSHRTPFAPSAPIYLTRVELFFGSFTLEVIDVFYREGAYFPRPEVDEDWQEFIHDYHLAVANVIDRLTFGEPVEKTVDAKLEFFSPVNHVRTASGSKKPLNRRY